MRRRFLGLVTAAGAAVALLAGAPLGCSDDPGKTAGDAAPEAQGLDATDARDAPDASDAAARVVPRGSRVLGIAVPLDDLDFPTNVQIARDAGARSTNATFAWNDIERPFDAGTEDAGDDAGDAGPVTQLSNPLLHVTNLVLDGYRMQATLTVDAVDVGGSRAPADLATRPLDDPEVAARYDHVTDYVLSQMPDVELNALFVASSVDVSLGDGALKHAAFTTFFARAAAHAHAVRPKLRVGFTVTADGLVANEDRLAAAWAASDVIGITYLPVDAQARVRSPSEVAADVDRLVAAIPAGKPIVVREAGYPTAAACGSSEVAQAAFVSALFGAWDRHADRLAVVTIRELLDADAASAAAQAQRSGRSDPAFLAFLQSLGVRSGSGDRPAFQALVGAARARGF